MLAALRVHDPQIGSCTIGHDVVGLPDVHDPRAVRRDLRIGRDFELEDVRVQEAIGIGFVGEHQSTQENDRQNQPVHGLYPSSFANVKYRVRLLFFLVTGTRTSV